MTAGTTASSAPVLKDGVVEKAVEAGGFHTRYLEAGDPGRTSVLLLHDGAWGGSSDVTWGSVIAELAQDYHVLAPDQLGFGGSDKVVFTDRPTFSYRIRHIAAFLSTVGLEGSAHIVGNSFGGTIALRSLATGSLPARSVVSIAGGGGPWRTPLSRELADWDGSREDLSRVLRLLVDDFPGFEAQLEARLHWARQPGHYRAVCAVGVPLPAPLREKHADDWPAPLRGVDVPLLLVRGQRDVLLEDDWPQRLAAVAPRCEEIVLDGRHAPNIDRPEAVIDLLRTFFADVDSRAGGRR